MNYHENFKTSLRELNLDPLHVFETYVYVGGNGNDINKDIIYLRNMEFKANFGDLPFPKLADKCLCGHPIVENCYISSEFGNYDNILIIGNCCYIKFLKNKNRLCVSCRDRHENKNGLCKHCSKLRNVKRKNIRKKINILPDLYCEELYNNIYREYEHDTNVEYINLLSKIYTIDYDQLLQDYKNARNSIVKEYCYDILMFKNYIKNIHCADKYCEIYNSIRIIKTILSDPYTIDIIHRCNYSILNIYYDSKLIITINLLTCKETSNSKFNINNMKYDILYKIRYLR